VLGKVSAGGISADRRSSWRQVEWPAAGGSRPACTSAVAVATTGPQAGDCCDLEAMVGH
jgi:hypothetical protein